MLQCSECTSVRDKERLIEIVDRAQSSWMTFAPYLEFFRTKLRLARAVPSAEIPKDLVTMNSRVAVTENRSGETLCYTLVYPSEESVPQGKLSILSPLGIALFGARVGNDVVWMADSGPKVVTIKRLLYQPEAANDLHL